jgi:hypothetical protein
MKSIIGGASARTAYCAWVVLCLATVVAKAEIYILPGESKALSGACENPGTVIYDQLVPFYIENPDGSYFGGNLQNRVVRLDSTGRLLFAYRIRDTYSNGNVPVYFIWINGFGTLQTAVEYSSCSSGTERPDSAYRTGGLGDFVGFGFFNEPISGGQESVFFSVNPQADCYAANTYAIIYTYDAQTSISVVGPGSGGSPYVDIQSPDDLSCACGTVQITGDSYDPGNAFEYDVLEYRPAGEDAWTFAGISFSERSGVLYNWDTSSLPTGWYTIKVTAFSGCGGSADDVAFVYVDHTGPNIDSRIPADGQIVGGDVCVEGFVTDYCYEDYLIEYSKDGVSWTVIPNVPSWPARLTTWDTSGLADGSYFLRIIASDICDNVSTHRRKVILDNTPPIAEITAPLNCSDVSGVVEIHGTASDANLSAWTLQYTGGDSNGWVTIASGASNVTKGLLAKWDTTRLRPCAYTIRLIVSDKATVNCVSNWWSEYLVSVNVGDPCPEGDRGDINCDDSVDFDDVDGFVECIINGGCEPCP